MMSFATKLDEVRAPIWITSGILGLIYWWPLGLAILACTIWSGKMRCCGMNSGRGNDLAADRTRQSQGWASQLQTSGNRAFGEYRTETLRRLEGEQYEFQDFLGRLRMAKDKTEFDQFMAEGRTRSEPQPRD